jgi:hemin uptake protein HemP
LDIKNELQMAAASAINPRVPQLDHTVSEAHTDPETKTMSDEHVIDPVSDSAARGISTAAVRRIPVGDLLGGGREVVLVHRNAEYRLRLTSNDKLILTK